MQHIIYFWVCIWLHSIQNILKFTDNYSYHSLSESLLYQLRDQSQTKFQINVLLSATLITYCLKLRNQTDKNNTISFSTGIHSGKFLYPYSGNGQTGIARDSYCYQFFSNSLCNLTICLTLTQKLEKLQ